MRRWLIKSEPDVFSIGDLAKVKVTAWDGVRNYQARNFMMNDAAVGDEVLFYHSNARPSGVAGLARVASAARPDETQFKKSSEYFEPRATRDKPIWFCNQIAFVRKFDRILSLDELRGVPELSGMALLARGQRLSVQPVTEREFRCILALSRR